MMLFLRTSPQCPGPSRSSAAPLCHTSAMPIGFSPRACPLACGGGREAIEKPISCAKSLGGPHHPISGCLAGIPASGAPFLLPPAPSFPGLRSQEPGEEGGAVKDAGKRPFQFLSFPADTLKSGRQQTHPPPSFLAHSVTAFPTQGTCSWPF